MAATYAHWRFGRECIEKMPKEIQKIVHENRDIYNIGVHGPDVFFYNLFRPNVSSYGYRMHKIPASDFFKRAKEIYQNALEDKNKVLVYALGFLTHFTLDSHVHSYVERKHEVSNISHNYVESQWERHCMLLDNRVPNLIDRSEHIKPTRKNCAIIAKFHPFLDKRTYFSIKAQRFVVRTINCITYTKQKGFQFVLRKIGLNDYADLYVGFSEDDVCKDSNLRLDKLFDKALKTYPKLFKSLMAYFNDECDSLIDYFENDFSYKKGYKDIPILSYNEELEYKVK